jgi:ribulose-phosphate 3-epimerase
VLFKVDRNTVEQRSLNNHKSIIKASQKRHLLDSPVSPDRSEGRGWPAIAPSMMCADFLDLGQELARFAAHGVEWLHQDIMDGHFVPNLALNADLCRLMAQAAPGIRHDVHLMVEEPERYIARFAGLPGLRVSFHPETTRHSPALIARIRDLGGTVGIAISPAFTVESFRHLLPLVDQVTVLTVNPGFAGQKLLDWCLPKISEVRLWAERHSAGLDISVDGNVSWENIPRMQAAGANCFVLGTSSIFQRDVDRDEALRRVRRMLAEKRGKEVRP